MTSWTSDELARIGAADELELATLRRDATLRISLMTTPEVRATTLRLVPRPPEAAQAL